MRESSNEKALIARGRLKDARRWFEQRGWNILPQGRRGQRIIQWAADHAWLANPANPRRSVSRWCRCWAPWLTAKELENILAVDRSSARWTHDQSAAVLEISVDDRESLGFRFLGAADDPDYKARDRIKKAKGRERQRRYRAAHRTGAKRGRPALNLSPAQRKARSNAQAAQRMRIKRAKSSIALRKNTSRDITIRDSVTEFSVTQLCVAESIFVPPELWIPSPPGRRVIAGTA